MITPVIQEATEAPQPIIPPPNFERKNRTPLIIALIVAGVILLPILLLGAGVILLRAGSGGEEVVAEQVGPAEQVDPAVQVDPAEQVVIIGEIDMEMGVQVILESGPAITLPDSVLPGQDRGVVEGSVQKVATVTSPLGVTDLYRYQSILLDSATQETMDCLGAAKGFNATASCRNLDETQPLLFWGTDVLSTGNWYSVGIAGLPLESTRLVTETVNGRSVGSTVVNGVSYQEWPATDGGQQFGKAARTVALNAQGEVVWSADGSN